MFLFCHQVSYELVYIIPDESIVVDEHIVVSVAASAVLLAESGHYSTVFFWLTPQRAVVAIKIEAGRVVWLTVFQAITEYLCYMLAAMFLNCRETDALDCNSSSYMVFIQALVRIGFGDSFQPSVGEGGGLSELLIFQQQFALLFCRIGLGGVKDFFDR